MATGGDENKGTTTQKTLLDPSTQALNEQRLRAERTLQPLREMIINAMLDPQHQGPLGLMLPSAESAAALNQLHGLSDVGALTDATSEHFNRIALPGIINTMTAQGFGRSGAISDALTESARRFTLPILDASRMSQANLASALMSLDAMKMGAVTPMLTSLPPFTSAPTSQVTARGPGSGGFSGSGAAIGGISGAAGGALSGAAIGAAGGPIGAMGGAVIGGLGGILSGGFR